MKCVKSTMIQNYINNYITTAEGWSKLVGGVVASEPFHVSMGVVFKGQGGCDELGKLEGM